MLLTTLFSRFVVSVLILFSLACCSIKPTSNNRFNKIFDGKTLKGWKGDVKYWRVEDGEIIGEVTPQTLLKNNSFLIWTGGQPSNFELKVTYRISAKGNSGVNYRSVQLDSLPFALKGYQADIDGKDKYGDGYPRHTGQNYEERGRQFLAVRGQKVTIKTGQKPLVTATLGSKEALLENIHYDDWNELHIIARGNHIQHFINGALMSEVIDNDTINRRMDGLIGVQVHVGPPMKIEFKDFLLKTIE